MRGAGEHVDGLDSFYGEAEGSEASTVACERSGITGDVDQALWRHVRNDCGQLRVKSFARRVYDYGVRVRILFFEFLCYFFGVTRKEFSVGDFVLLCILLCVLYGFGDYFNPDKFFSRVSECQAYCARTAVEVKEKTVVLTGKLFHLVVELLALGCVDLEK